VIRSIPRPVSITTASSALDRSALSRCVSLTKKCARQNGWFSHFPSKAWMYMPICTCVVVMRLRTMLDP